MKKLRNKKTGEIIDIYKGEITLHYNHGKKTIHFKRLEELEEWEDVPEEPKSWWYINEFGTPIKADFVGRETLYDKCRKSFCNYFETEEEAEKAVKKLKAFKRLKDKGFRFDGYDVAHKSNGNLAGQIFYDAGNYSIEDVEKEMDLLFGGEE